MERIDMTLAEFFKYFPEVYNFSTFLKGTVKTGYFIYCREVQQLMSIEDWTKCSTQSCETKCKSIPDFLSAKKNDTYGYCYLMSNLILDKTQEEINDIQYSLTLDRMITNVHKSDT